MEITEDHYKDVIGYIGWLTAQRMFNHSSTVIDYSEVERLYFMENALQSKMEGFTQKDLKACINYLVKNNFLKFSKKDDKIYLRLAVAEFTEDKKGEQKEDKDESRD